MHDRNFSVLKLQSLNEVNKMTSTNEIKKTLNVTERAVAELWCEVLQTDVLPNANDDFFSLGGDSMSMVALEFRIREEFSVELPPGVMLRAPTLRDLAALVAAAYSYSTEPDVQTAGSNPM